MLIPIKRGPTVEYGVRYAKGRKSFPKLEGRDPAIHARAFAEEQRVAEGGWAEITEITTRMIEKRR